MSSDEVDECLGLQRDTLLHQSARISRHNDEIEIIKARLADQDAQIFALRLRMRGLARRTYHRRRRR